MASAKLRQHTTRQTACRGSVAAVEHELEPAACGEGERSLPRWVLGLFFGGGKGALLVVRRGNNTQQYHILRSI